MTGFEPLGSQRRMKDYWDERGHWQRGWVNADTTALTGRDCGSEGGWYGSLNEEG